MGDMEEMDYVADSEEEDRLPIERGSEGLGKRREQGIGGSEQSNGEQIPSMDNVAR